MEEDDDDMYAPAEANGLPKANVPENAVDSEAMDEDEEEESDSVCFSQYLRHILRLTDCE